MRWIIALTGLLLTGCASYYGGGYYGPRATSIDQVDLMVGTQQPVEYRVGFQSGCDSGSVSAGNRAYTFKKDVVRYDVDALYKQGWDDGYNRCRENPVPYSGGYYSSSYYYGPDYYYGYYPGLHWSSRYYYGSHYYYPYGSGIHLDTHYYSPYYSPRLKHYKRHRYGGGHHSSGYNFKALHRDSHQSSLHRGSHKSSSRSYKALQPKSHSGSGKVNLRQGHSKGSHSKGSQHKSKSHESGKRSWKRMR